MFLFVDVMRFLGKVLPKVTIREWSYRVGSINSSTIWNILLANSAVYPIAFWTFPNNLLFNMWRDLTPINVFFPVGLILGALSFLGGGSFSHHFTSLSKSLFDNNVEDPDDEENDEEKVVGCIDIKGDKPPPNLEASVMTETYFSLSLLEETQLTRFGIFFERETSGISLTFIFSEAISVL